MHCKNCSAPIISTSFNGAQSWWHFDARDGVKYKVCRYQTIAEPPEANGFNSFEFEETTP